MYAESDVSELRVISVSSFSKLIGPGFRMGWIHSFNKQLVNNIVDDHGPSISGGPMTNFTYCLLRYVFDDITKHVVFVRKQLQRRCLTMCNLLHDLDSKHLLSFVTPSGGYFIWIRLPNGITVNDIIEQNKKRNHTRILFKKGIDNSSRFGPLSAKIQCDIELLSALGIGSTEQDTKQKKRFNQCLRLCFAYLNEDEIKQGIRCLVECIYALCGNVANQSIKMKSPNK